MNKYRAYYPLDNAPQAEGDGAWRGVNNRLDPSQLDEGWAADAENVRFVTGQPSTRKGARIMAWASHYQSGDASGVIRPFGAVLAADRFSNPISGFEWQIVVTEDGAFRIRPGNRSQSIPVAAGESLSSATKVVQTYDGLVLLRGPEAQPLYLQSFDEGFLAVPEPAAGLEAIPPMTEAIYFQNRLIGVDARIGVRYSDSFWVSDIGGITSVLAGDAVVQSFKVNQGSADRLVAGYKFNELSMLALKEGSVYVISNIYGSNEDLAANTRLDLVTDEYGCMAPRAIVQVGSDVWFLGHLRGICSVTQTAQNKLQGVDAPKSLDIQGWVDRINWSAAADSQAAVHDNKVYFAVPIDGSSENNAVLVYSTLTQSWQSLDTGDALAVRRWIKFTWDGAVRLGYVSSDGFVYCYEHGYRDETGDEDGVITRNPIRTKVVTRAYGGRSAGQKQFRRWTLRARTWNPSITIASIADGAHERETVKTITRDRTKYLRPYGKADYDPTDAADDASQKYREDYSVAAPFAVRTSGNHAFGILQDLEESGRVRNGGQAVQLEVVSTQGRIEVAGVTLETARGSTRNGTRS